MKDKHFNIHKILQILNNLLIHKFIKTILCNMHKIFNHVYLLVLVIL